MCFETACASAPKAGGADSHSWCVDEVIEGVSKVFSSTFRTEDRQSNGQTRRGNQKAKGVANTTLKFGHTPQKNPNSTKKGSYWLTTYRKVFSRCSLVAQSA